MGKIDVRPAMAVLSNRFCRYTRNTLFDSYVTWCRGGGHKTRKADGAEEKKHFLIQNYICCQNCNQTLIRTFFALRRKQHAKSAGNFFTFKRRNINNVQSWIHPGKRFCNVSFLYTSGEAKWLISSPFFVSIAYKARLRCQTERDLHFYSFY